MSKDISNMLSSGATTYGLVRPVNISSIIMEGGTNEDDLVLTRFIVQRVLVPIIAWCGSIGNVISICVLTQRSMSSSTNCYLTTLAVFDLLYLVFSFSLSLKHYNIINSYAMFRRWLPFGKVFADICSNVSVLVTVTFSFERLIAVYYPMRSRTLCTVRRARTVSLGVVVFAVVCTTPEFFETRVTTVHINNTCSTIAFVESEMAQTVAYKVGYLNFIVLIFTILPLIFLSTFNGILIKTVLVTRRIRNQMTGNIHEHERNRRRQKEQNRITMMLVVVVIVFLICQFPNAVLIFYLMNLNARTMPRTIIEANNIRIAGNIVNLLILINASINFILYSAMSIKFRRVCKRLLIQCCRKNKKTCIHMRCYRENYAHFSCVPVQYRSQQFSKGKPLGRSDSSESSFDHLQVDVIIATTLYKHMHGKHRTCSKMNKYKDVSTEHLGQRIVNSDKFSPMIKRRTIESKAFD